MKTEQGRGTVRTIRNRSTGEILGYQALLPREQSKPPPGCANPERYQEPVGPRCATKAEARGLLDAVVLELRDRGAVKHGLPLSHYVGAAIQARYQEARRAYRNDARATRHTATWRSADRRWLKKASWYDWPPASIELPDLQRFFDWLRDEAEGKAGDPLSGSFVRQVASVTRAAFERAGIHPNPAADLKLPKKSEPRVAFLSLASQRLLFGSEDIELADRIMIGCGMGAGLRVGELLAMEPADVHLDDHDPHLVVRYGGAHRAPPKGRKVQRVELFEPGLGFWRLWMEKCYTGGDLVFGGPKGGYAKAWPERFPAWAPVAAVERLSSHIMRHTYAVAVLSGTWGYEPRSLEFVSQQLRHRERTTTERFYGGYEVGVWQRDVRAMTGRAARATQPITAAELLGADVSGDVSIAALPEEVAFLVQSPSLTRNSRSSEETKEVDAFAHQAFESLVSALQAAADRDPHALPRLIHAATEGAEALRLLLAPDESLRRLA